MAEKWDDKPVKVVVEATKPSMDRADPSKQEVGKYAVNGLLKWGLKRNGTWCDFFGPEAPAVGEEIEIRRNVKVEDNGDEKYPKWVLESQYQKSKGGGGGRGGFGGGAIKPNLTPEQEMMDKAIGHAVEAINNGVIAGDGNPMPANFQNLEKFTNWAYKKISEAGKKPEAQQ